MSEFKNELHQQIIFYQNQPSFLDVILGKKKAAIQEKKIVIFGAGVLGKQAALAFKHTGVIIDRFIDNNSEKWNLEYKGIKCQSPESLSEDARDCFVLISPATDTSKIVAQLKNIGLTEDQILWNQEATSQIRQLLLLLSSKLSEQHAFFNPKPFRNHKSRH